MQGKIAIQPFDSYCHSQIGQITILEELGAREIYEKGPHIFSFHEVDITCETDVFSHIEVGLTVLSPEYPLQRKLQLKAYGGAKTEIVVMEISAEWYSEGYYSAAILLITANEEIRMQVGPSGNGRVRVSDLHGNGRALSQIESESVLLFVSDLLDPEQKDFAWQRVCEELQGEN